MTGDLALAVDLGGTKVEAALVDDRGTVIPGSRHRAPTGRESSSAQLAQSVTEVIHRALGAVPPGTTVAGVGVGSAGPVAIDRGEVSPLNLPAWRGFPLLAHVATSAAGLPVTLRMDGECITLAEHWVGAGVGERNLLAIVVSTGVGGGLILDGRAVAGPTGNAGHIGHIEVGGFDDACPCGGIGCVEAVASGPSTTAWARRHGWTGMTGEELAASCAAGDATARAAVERAARALGQGIASATALVDLELVTIGGGFSRVSPDLVPLIRETIARRAPFPFVAKVRVEASTLTADGPLIGAAALVHRADAASDAG